MISMDIEDYTDDELIGELNERGYVVYVRTDMRESIKKLEGLESGLIKKLEKLKGGK